MGREITTTKRHEGPRNVGKVCVPSLRPNHTIRLIGNTTAQIKVEPAMKARTGEAGIR